MAYPLYDIALKLALPVVLARAVWRALRGRDPLRRLPERFGHGQTLHGQPIWIHAVSVGEVRAAAPIIQRLRATPHRRPILLTCTTPTGSATARRLYGNQVTHCYAPYDLPTACARFLDRTQPRLAVILETEIWPNLYSSCRARDIPLMIVNARISDQAYGRYRRLRRFTRQVLTNVDLVLAQSEEDANRFRALGASAVDVAGNLKFDVSLPQDAVTLGQRLERTLGNRPVWIAASTHPGEEVQVLAAYGILRENFPALLLILVPRHPERAGDVEKLCVRAGYRVVRRSRQQDAIAPGHDILLGDTLGELPGFYFAARENGAAFIGGSLVPVGGHNLLEAAAADCPAVVGPHMYNFQEICDRARAAGAIREAVGPRELAHEIARILNDPVTREAMQRAGRRLIESNQGATEKVFARLECLARLSQPT